MTTGEKMRIRRRELGLTVDEVADRVGKNRATIYRYESDAIEMPANMVKPLADALGTTPDDLMGWNTLLEDIALYNERMDGVLPQIENGVSVAGGIHSYILFKSLNRGGHLGHDLQSLLSVAHRLNSAGCESEMHSIRILAELACTLGEKSLEHLIAYAEFLDARNQEKLGETIQHPHQLERSDSLLLD